MFERRVLRRRSEPGEEERTGGLGKMHNAELHNLQGLLLAKSD